MTKPTANVQVAGNGGAKSRKRIWRLLGRVVWITAIVEASGGEEGAVGSVEAVAAVVQADSEVGAANIVVVVEAIRQEV